MVFLNALLSPSTELFHQNQITMKALFISGAMLLAGFAHAQDKVHVGLKAGVNFSNMATSPDAGYKTKAGFNAGALAHIHLNKTWAIQPEIYYSGQGAKSNNIATRLDYVNVPVQLQYMFNKGFRIQTGPQLGVLAAASVKQDKTVTSIRNSMKPMDFGWTFGASYVSEGGLGVDARYNRGLTRINESGPVNTYNSVFQVGLFYLIKHKY